LPATTAKLFTPLHTYYMSPTGSDSNNGTSASTPWATPNHAVNCGDVIIAAAGNYTPKTSFGAVSNCPSTSGGIDGTGGIYFAVLLCGGSSVGACTVAPGSGCTAGAGIETGSNNWAVEGWRVSMGYSTSCTGSGFNANTSSSTYGVVHHVAYINDIATDNAWGFGSSDSHGTNAGTGYGIDYWAVVGSITQNSAGREDGYYTASNVVIGAKNYDTVAGTHIFIDGNYAYNNLQIGSTGNTTDGEDYMFDTNDALGYTQKMVFRNNYGVKAERNGLQLFYQNMSPNGYSLYIYNNTFYDNNTNPDDTSGGSCCAGVGEINIQSTVSTDPNLYYIYSNIAQATVHGTWNNGAGYGYPYALVSGGAYVAATNIGAVGSVNPSNGQNIFKADQTTCKALCNSGDDVVTYGGSATYYGVNTYVDPGFTNTTDLLNNQMGVPNCSSFTNTTACMGYNANTGVLTTPSFISDLVPTAGAAAGKGVQLPSTICNPSDPDYPTWLKGIVYLYYDGIHIWENTDLVTVPCGM
jgi:hypothetical protein